MGVRTAAQGGPAPISFRAGPSNAAELGSWQAPLSCWGGMPLWRVAIILAAVAFASSGWLPGQVAIAADLITGN